MEELGGTIGAIAAEKAGVFRSGRPALVASPLPEARQAFRAAADRAGAVLHEMAVETRVAPEEGAALAGTRFRLATPLHHYALESPLPGRHQASNAATAVRAAELLWPTIDPLAIARGVASVRWPGRLERFSAHGRTVVLDGCHNPEGARAIARFLEEARIRPDLIFAAMADKDIEAMAAALGGASRRVLLAPALSARSAAPEELARRFAGSRPDARTAPSLAAALEEVLADPSSETIIVAGSLYLVGEARALFLSGRFDRD